MNKALCLVVLSMVMIASGNAATVTITGTVHDTAGARIALAAVKLLHMTNVPAAYSSQSNGSFTLSGTTSGITYNARKQESLALFSVKGSNFYFSTITPGEKVTLKLLDLQGRLQQTIIRTFSAAGPQAISLGSAKPAAGIHFISLSSNSQSGLFSALSAGRDLISLKTLFWKAEGIAAVKALGKSRGTDIDTVQISHKGFKTVLVPIASYQTDLGVIVMTSVPETV
jgi:hypothetical protein